MPVNVAAILRTALRQLETERDRVDRQRGALRTVLNSGVPAKALTPAPADERCGAPSSEPPHG